MNTGRSSGGPSHILRCAVAVTGLVCLAHRSYTAEPVVVRETTMEIPTYVLQADDPNPPLENLGVYPYPMQTGITRHQELKTHRVVIMENAYVRVIILPDLGGRVYAAHDKTNQDADFIYHNHVIKPALVALRGAWISGGIEWNFPTRGHTVNTFSPVQYAILRDQDGSATCVVGTPEWVRRMHWSVRITVYPDRAFFRDRIVLTNPTLTHQRAYYWSNAAVHARPETRVILPPADHTFAGMRRRPEPWPVKEGQDLSWYKNTPSAHDYFCGVPGDYHGAYQYDQDLGTVHVASAQDSPGTKFWTWGTARSGGIWENLLTDDDGQYIEVQAGRLLTQGDTWIFEPHMQESWDEYWYPIKRMRGFVKANRDAAVNLTVENTRLFAAVNTTRRLRDATIRIVGDGQTVLQESITVGPQQPWKQEIQLAAPAGTYLLIVKDAHDQPIIRYETRPAKSPPPEIEPEFPPAEASTAEQTYLKGYYALKHWHTEQAAEYFRQSLKQDDGFTPALRMLALLHFQSGQYAEARQMTERVLARNEDDWMARYYGALASIKLRQSDSAVLALATVGRRAAYRHVAPYVLASLCVRRGAFRAAERQLRQAIRNQADDDRSRIMLAAVLRHQGKRDQSAALIERVLQRDPLNNLAIVESRLSGGSPRLEVLRDDPQYYLEVACDYIQMNLFEDAIDTLEIFLGRDGAVAHPFVHYYLGYLADRTQAAKAAQHFTKGSNLPAAYVFPFRTESLEVLRTGLRYDPDSWQLHYYLGLLLAAKSRWQEGLENLQAAALAKPDFSVLYASLGDLYLHRTGDSAKAMAAFEQARKCDPADLHYYVILDELYDRMQLPARRHELLQQAPAAVKQDFRFLYRQADYLYDTQRYDDALKLLKNNTFLPWEGGTRVWELYRRILQVRAKRWIDQQEFARAMEDLEQAMKYPENLGTGRPARPNHAQELVQMGQCCEALGKIDQATRYYTEAIQQPGQSTWHDTARRSLESLKKHRKE